MEGRLVMAKTSKALDKLVDRCLKSARFRDKLVNDPAGALRDLKIYNPQRLKAVKKLSFRELQKLAEAFGYDRFFKGRDAN
jgi:hypothetical protein